MDNNNVRLIRHQIRSPRSAAVAGIIFSILMTAGMVLMYSVVSDIPADIDRSWLATWSGTASVVLIMVPFAGIAFLWFTGVVRDRLGDLEDHFFATIYFGSSIIIVVMLFIWAATVGAIFGSFSAVSYQLVDDDIIIFGFKFMNEIIGNYTLRMAGVYMTAIGTAWTRTGVMPRWLSGVTFVVAIGFLFFAGTVREARFIFPGWVFVVSVYILILNYRRSNEDTLKT